MRSAAERATQIPPPPWHHLFWLENKTNCRCIINLTDIDQVGRGDFLRRLGGFRCCQVDLTLRARFDADLGPVDLPFVGPTPPATTGWMYRSSGVRCVIGCRLTWWGKGRCFVIDVCLANMSFFGLTPPATTAHGWVCWYSRDSCGHCVVNCCSGCCCIAHCSLIDTTILRGFLAGLCATPRLLW